MKIPNKVEDESRRREMCGRKLPVSTSSGPNAAKGAKNSLIKNCLPETIGSQVTVTSSGENVIE